MKNKLTREECEKVFDNLKYQYQDGHKVDVSSIYDKDFEIINQLIEEHFELVELIEKWGLSDFSIEELDKWRDRAKWHVKKVDEMHFEIESLKKQINELKSNSPLKLEEFEYPMYLYQIETTDGLQWVASFPDLDGCIGGGKTKIEAINEAKINLKEYLEASKEIGIPIPKPYERIVLK